MSRCSRTLETVKLLARPGGRVLLCGYRAGELMGGLLGSAFDVVGVDTARVSTIASRGRLLRADRCLLPFSEDRFSTIVVSPQWLDGLESGALDRAIAELARVAAETVVFETPGCIPSAHAAAGGGHSREWWEQRLIDGPFRRHTRTLAVNDYESLEEQDSHAVLAVQKLPRSAAACHPLASLRAERDLHMDMLRETGRRADAHLARYEWAREWIKPGDTVVDAACGLGYGSALLWDGSEAARVVGIDVSDTAVAYARDNFMPGRPGVEFRVSDAEAWQGWPDASVDCVLSFETIEHLANPIRFMAGVQRVLKPGGRFLCSVPNMWVDETGRDPNPHHLHVFDLDRLTGLVSSVLLVDEVYAQSAGGHAARFAPRRLLRSIGWPGRDSELVSGAEWWLLSGIKDPLCGSAVPYVEQVFPAPAGREPNAVAFARDYMNPWAVHALVMGSFRVRSPWLLSQLATRWLAASPPRSADAGAALCVLAYRALEGDAASDVVRLIGDIREYCDGSPLNPQARRWQVSLRFVRGKLHLHRGELAEAERCFRACAAEDASAFTPHLETKTTEAAWLAGRLALERGDAATAAADWSGVSEALERVKALPVRDWLVSPERPAAFERGDGLREIAIAVDNAALCANALRRLRDPSGAWRPGPDPVDRNFQRNTAHLLETVRRRGGEIAALRAEVERGRVELQPVHEQWKATREALHDVTRRLRAVLGTRDAEAASTIGSRWKAENAALRATITRLLRGGNGTAAERSPIDARALATIQAQWDRLQHAPPERQQDRSPARVGIFGTGEAAMKVWEALAGLDEADVVWFADNDARQQGRRLLWIGVIAPGDIPAHGCDAVVVGSMSRDAIRSQLLNLGTPAGRILTPDVQQSVPAIRAALRQFLSVAQRQ